MARRGSEAEREAGGVRPQTTAREPRRPVAPDGPRAPDAAPDAETRETGPPHPRAGDGDGSLTPTEALPGARASDVTDETRDDADRKSHLQLEPGSRVDRYVIVGKLGHGGMGLVYRGYDPELDRRVAIKMLRIGRRRPQAAERLLREARALARLAHPNVVAVHDVGMHDGAVYVVMELIAGTTLRRWVRGRSLREVLTTLVAAGRGLESAHQAGMVHRDFKPSNVLVGDDGRARVLDFGLVRADVSLGSSTGSGERPRSPVDDDVRDELELELGSESASSLAAPLTLAGTVMGTPAYMAPEQLDGEIATARSDQFAFCVTAYEAAFGVLPFPGSDRDERKRRIAAGEIAPPTRRVPAWLRSALVRGLASDPDDRFSSMTELLAVIERGLGRRRRLLGVSAAAAIAVASATGAVVLGAGAPTPRCGPGSDAAQAAWTDARPDVERALLATGAPHARDVLARVDRVLTGYTSRWRDMHTQACEATHVRHVQSPALLDLRAQCLDRRLHELRALVGVLAGAESTEVVDNAVQASRQLVPVERCADVEALRAAMPLPDSPQMRAEIEAIERTLDRAGALRQAGRFEPGLALAGESAARARTTAFPPLVARAHLLLGELQAESGAYAPAEEALDRALEAAARAGDEATGARVWNQLLWVIGIRLARLDEALALRRAAEAAVLAAGDDAELRADLLVTLSALLDEHGDFAEAAALGEEAVALYEEKRPEHPDLPRALNGLGILHGRHGKAEEAAQYFRRALALAEAQLGADHPGIARYLNNVGIALARVGDHRGALATYERAFALYERTVGGQHPFVANALAGLAVAHQELGEHARAVDAARRAIAILTSSVGADHPDEARAWSIIATSKGAQGDPRGALEAARRALDIYQARFGEDHVMAVSALTSVAEHQLAAGAPAEAIAVLERALTLSAPHTSLPELVATAEWMLARALWDHRPAQRGRALALARSARGHAGEAEEPEVAAEIDAWLANR